MPEEMPMENHIASLAPQLWYGFIFSITSDQAAVAKAADIVTEQQQQQHNNSSNNNNSVDIIPTATKKKRRKEKETIQTLKMFWECFHNIGGSITLLTLISVKLIWTCL